MSIGDEWLVSYSTATIYLLWGLFLLKYTGLAFETVTIRQATPWYAHRPPT